MKSLTLKRISNSEKITYGVFIDDSTGLPLCLSLELPWMENRRSISCIPEGKYYCEPYTSAKYKDVFQVMDVRDRSSILIHVGNKLSHTEGCILPGMQYGYLNGEIAVLGSSAGLSAIKAAVPENKFVLNVVSV